MIIGYTLGHVSFQVSNPILDPDLAEDYIRLRRQRLPADEFPSLTEALPYIAGCDFDAAFDFGLDALLRGLEVKLASIPSGSDG